MTPVFSRQCFAKRVPALAIAQPAHAVAVLALAIAQPALVVAALALESAGPSLAIARPVIATAQPALAIARSVLSGAPHGIGRRPGQIAAHGPARPSLFFASPVAAGHARGE